MKRYILILLLGVMQIGCKTQKATAPQPIVLNNNDSVHSETIIETTYIPVEVEVDLPQQSKTNMSTQGSSHLETNIAESDAWINPDGSIGHSLTNKTGNLKGSVYVPQTTTQTSKDAIRTREVAVPEPYPVYIERKRTKSEQLKLASFWYVVTAAIVSIAYIFRKPFLIVLRKLIRL